MKNKATCRNFLITAALVVQSVFCSGAASQSSTLINYTNRDGLPSMNVYCIMQDHEGYIWLGTDAGVSRFDGRTFDNFSVDDGLSDNEIIRIVQDSKNRIWFMTINGNLNYFFKGRFYNSENSKLLSNTKINSSYLGMLEDDQHNLWFGTYDGEVFRIGADDKVSQIDFKFWEHFQHRGRLHVTINANGEVCATNGSTLINLRTSKAEPGFSNVNVEVHYSQIPRMLLYGKKDGIYTYVNGKTEKRINYKFNIDSILRLYIDARERIYVLSTQYKLTEFSVINGMLKIDTIGISKPTSQTYSDKDGNTWFVTLGDGIYMRPPVQLDTRFFNSQTGLGGDNVMSAIALNDTAVLLGFQNNYIQVIDDKSFLHSKIRLDNHERGRMMGFHSATDGRIWAASDNGLFSIKPNDENYVIKQYYFYFDDVVDHLGAMKAVAGNSKGDIVVVETSGLFLIKKGNMIGYQLDEKLVKRRRVFSVLYDHFDNLWFSTNEGLWKLKDKNVERFSKKHKALSGKIVALKETVDNILLVGTIGNGLIMMKDDKVIKTIAMSEGLESNDVRCIAVEDSFIYVGTDRGISRITLKQDYSYSITNFGKTSGLLSENVNCIAITKGYVYVGTNEGLTLLKRPLNVLMRPLPEVYIKSLMVSDVETDATQPFRVPHDFRNILIEFTSPVYLNADKVVFRYRFDGSQQEWVETRNGKIDLFGLQDGKYIMQVQAKRSDSDWGKLKLVSFEVMPPFGKTWWFRLLTAIFIVIVSYFVIRSVVSRKYKEKLRYFRQQQALEVERRRISEDMHDDLGADLTNIVIMSKVARRTISKDASYSDVVDNIGDAANDVISKMNEIVWALNPGNDTLENLLAYLRTYSDSYCEMHNLELHFDSPQLAEDKTLNASFRRNIFLSVKECLHNIVKHAKAKNVYISIKINEIKQCLEVTVRDDGKGIVKDAGRNPRSGNGLINLKKRMTEIDGSVNVETESEKGTSVKLSACFNRNERKDNEQFNSFV